MISKFSIISLLTLAVFALHVDHQELNVTASTSLDQIISDLTAFNSSVHANTAYSEKITDNKDFSDFLKRALDRQMADLYIAEASMIPTIAITPNTCSDLNDTERAELVKKLECAQGKLMNLTKYLQTLKNATIQQELYRRTSLEYLYVQQIKKGIQNSCQQSSKIASSSLFYNLAAQNWIFGANVTKQDVASLYSSAASHGTMTICDIATPFIKIGTTQCFACPTTSPIFDLTQQACTKCPGNSTYNNTSHRCECDCNCSINTDGFCVPKAIVYYNGNYLNLAGSTTTSISRYTEIIRQYVADAKTVSGQCAQDQNSRLTECIKCKAGEYFLVDTYTCTSCPNFDPATKLCSGATGASTSTTTSNNPIVVNPSVTQPTGTTPSVTQQPTATDVTYTEPTTTNPTVTQPATTTPTVVAPTAVVVTTVTTTVTDGSTTASNTAAPSTSTSTSTLTPSTGATISYVDDTTPASVAPTTVAPTPVNTVSNTGSTSTTSTTSSTSPAATVPPVPVQPTTVDYITPSPTTSTSTTTTGTTGITSNTVLTSTTTGNTAVTSNTSSSNVSQYSGANFAALTRIFSSNPNLIQVVNTNQQCPADTPFYTGNTSNPCINCQGFFNWDTKQCDSCPTGTTFQNNLCI